MTVSLSPELERLEALKALIDVGLESAEAGCVSPVSDDLIAEIKRLGRSLSGVAGASAAQQS